MGLEIKKFVAINALGESDLVDTCGKGAKAFDAPVVVFSTLTLGAEQLFPKLGVVAVGYMKC